MGVPLGSKRDPKTGKLIRLKNGQPKIFGSRKAATAKGRTVSTRAQTKRPTTMRSKARARG